MAPRTIYMNTKSEGSIALTALTPISYLKEVFDEKDVLGSLKKEKRITLPINRDGQTFENVDQLFAHLLSQNYVEI